MIWPEPVPVVLVANVYDVPPDVLVNVAVTFLFAFMMSTHELPVQSPEYPSNLEFEPATASSMTCVPAVYVGPTGARLTVPLPDPVFVTLRVYATGGGVMLNVAVTVLWVLMFTTQAPFPEQAPVNSTNVEPNAAAAVTGTGVFAG